MNQLQNLNPRQKAAAAHHTGPLMIIAGAGAGKTKTIAHRILQLIINGVPPQKILAITFTNKAAGEMRQRITGLLRSDAALNRPVSMADSPFVSTFHSLGVHILKTDGRSIGVPARFTIFDRSDSRRSVKEATERAGFDPKEFDPARLLASIAKQKGAGVSVNAFQETPEKEFWARLVSAVWGEYEKILRDEHALDFDDLLLKTVELFKKNELAREKYQNCWTHLHIDEYQDTNKVQYELALTLARQHRNICVVGDSDQMIYSWRGARMDNMWDFERDFPDATTVLLEENYRSTKKILRAANSIIGKNTRRKEKNLFTENSQGESLALITAYDEADEAHQVALMSNTLITSGVPRQEIAVLYRANFQSRALEEAFLNAEIPYQIVGTSFFERKEVKDVLSFIRAALVPESQTDLARIINVPARGIGKVTLLKILAGTPIIGAGGQKVRAFFNLLGRIRNFTLTNKPSAIIKFVVAESGIGQWLGKGAAEDAERLENVKELATLALRYDELPLGEGVEKLLEDAALASDQDELKENTPRVKLMTVHAAKGLEFEYVFVAGMEEGLFPHERATFDDDYDDEEERRLFYVALTRAKKKVFLSHASVRTIFGSRQVTLPSEFLHDIPDDTLETAMGEKPTKTIYL